MKKVDLHSLLSWGVFKFWLSLLLLICAINYGYTQNKEKISEEGKDTISLKSDVSILSLPPDDYPIKELTVIPPSPTAASLGKYGEIPVTMYSGTPNIEIPLFELESTKLKLRVNMSYQASGVKVSEIPGWVGLGWALHAGGVITRTVNNLADEVPDYGYIDFCQNLPTSYYEADCDFMNTLAASDDGFIDDAEPDVFFFNFHGFSGKFVFGDDGEPKLIPFQKLDIQKQLGTLGSTYGITGFTVKSPDGTRYEFGGTGAVEVTSFQKPGPDPESFFSSWYLTKIVSSDLKDTIKFTYTGHTYTSDVRVSQSMVCESNCGPYYSCGSLSSSASYELISSKTVDSIESKKGRITFSASDRADCDGGKKLTTVSLFTNNEARPIKTFQFSYSDVLSSPADAGYAGKRMFLDHVTVLDSMGVSIGKHSFSYYNRTSLPPRTSNAQDHWGFFNGANSNTSLIPASALYGLSGANREPNENYVKNGILEKIIYPTGGYTEFVYEAHKNGSAMLCGGVRIKEIHHYDGYNATIKKYTYDSGELLSASPVYEYTIQFPDQISGNWCNVLYRQAFSQVPLGGSNGSFVGYPSVTEWMGLSGEGGKTIRSFSHYFDQSNSSYPFTPGISMDWARGVLENEKHYRNDDGQYTLVEESIYDYGDITGNSQNSYDVKGVRVGYLKSGIPPYIISCDQYFSSDRYLEYFYRSRWFYLRKKTKKSYFTEGTLTEEIKYYHANPIHIQITKVTELTSSGDSLCTIYYYTHDYGSNFQSLINSHIIGKPIDIRVYSNSQLIGGKQIEYNNFGLPTVIRQARISAGESISFDNNEPYTFDSLVYIYYNDHFNIREISPVNSYPTTYLWSYGNTYPVMKIENSTYLQITDLAGSYLSDLRNATNQSVINDKMENIKTSLSPISSKIRITGFKYQPHIGITEISDQTNVRTSYFYDTMGRLLSVTNDERHLLNQYLYNYKYK